jgi:hypothetical protein
MFSYEYDILDSSSETRHLQHGCKTLAVPHLEPAARQIARVDALKPGVVPDPAGLERVNAEGVVSAVETEEWGLADVARRVMRCNSTQG